MDYGTVFKLDAANGYALTTLHSFGGPDGAYPYAALIADASGNLYGTTSADGDLDDGGTVFRLDAANGYALTTLHHFDGHDGAHPYAALIADASGDFFGTTYGESDGASSGHRFQARRREQLCADDSPQLRRVRRGLPARRAHRRRLGQPLRNDVRAVHRDRLQARRRERLRADHSARLQRRPRRRRPGRRGHRRRLGQPLRDDPDRRPHERRDGVPARRREQLCADDPAQLREAPTDATHLPPSSPIPRATSTERPSAAAPTIAAPSSSSTPPTATR